MDRLYSSQWDNPIVRISVRRRLSISYDRIIRLSIIVTFTSLLWRLEKSLFCVIVLKFDKIRCNFSSHEWSLTTGKHIWTTKMNYAPSTMIVSRIVGMKNQFLNLAHSLTALAGERTRGMKRQILFPGISNSQLTMHLNCANGKPHFENTAG